MTTKNRSTAQHRQRRGARDTPTTGNMWQRTEPTRNVRSSTHRPKCERNGGARSAAAIRNHPGKHEQRRLLTQRRANTTIAACRSTTTCTITPGATRATRPWSGTARPLDRCSATWRGNAGSPSWTRYAPDIAARFATCARVRVAWKPRTERTIQTYARSARAFSTGWYATRRSRSNPFDRVVFPMSGSRSSRPSMPRNLNGCLLPGRRPTNPGRSPTAPRWATGRPLGAV